MARNEQESSHFIRTMIENDLQQGRVREVVTRFPPEPNGYLHIGHVKAIVLNFGMAEEFGGRCHLRFDDTNPVKEDLEYVEAIQRDIRWLGFDWGEHLYYASDYFERMYGWAEQLIRQGQAYVDSQTEDEIRATRGTVTEPGTPSPWRDRSPEENLDLFRRMRAGEFPDGAHVLRARIDMASPNMKMRDPLLYRIRHAHHHRTGDAWCIYPFYDYAHPLSDAIEGITHSLCTLEFENNRELYDWVLDALGFEEPRPHQTEFARLSLTHVVTSKRKLLALVQGGYVSGWDDPRMPTIAGARRRGYRPEALRAFVERVGMSRATSTVDHALLEHTVRDDLNTEAPRVLAVARPLEVVVENWPEGEVDHLDASYWPHDVPKQGSRRVPFGKRLYIERDDFEEHPPKGFHRLAPGREVRLRYAYLLTCTGVEKDDTGEIVRLRGTIDPDSRGGVAPDGRKVPGTIHWVSADHALPAELRLYGRLFRDEQPTGDPDSLDPESRVVTRGWVEPSVADDPPDQRYQFERLGYFWRDADSRPDALVFGRIVALKDSWAKVQKAPAPAPKPARAEPPPPPPPPEAHRELDAAQRRFADAWVARGVSEPDAALLAAEDALRALFLDAVAAHDAPRSIARWIVNDVQRERKERGDEPLPFGGAEIGRLAALVDDGTLTSTAAKEVFAVLAREGGDPRRIVDERGLARVADEGVLAPVVRRVVQAHPDHAARYRENPRLMGFFVGQVMKETAGKADPQLVQRLLRDQLER